jgi:transketolase
MVVVAPGDPAEAEAATRAVAAHAGPCYLRLGRAGEAKVHQGQIHFQLGKAIQVRDGEDLTLISTGGQLETAVQVAESLGHTGLETRVLSMHTVKPLDSDAIFAAARQTSAVFTLEEHSVDGGLGGAVAELLAEVGEVPIVFKRFGLPSAFSSVVGTQEYLRAHHGLSVEFLTSAIRSRLEKNRNLTVTTAS